MKAFQGILPTLNWFLLDLPEEKSLLVEHVMGGEWERSILCLLSQQLNELICYRFFHIPLQDDLFFGLPMAIVPLPGGGHLHCN